MRQPSQQLLERAQLITSASRNLIIAVRTVQKEAYDEKFRFPDALDDTLGQIEAQLDRLFSLLNFQGLSDAKDQPRRDDRQAGAQAPP